MNAALQEDQELTPRVSRAANRLKTVAQIRCFTAKIIRQIYKDEIDPKKGSSLVWACSQLHRMVTDETAGTANSQNVLVVTGELSPAVRLARELWGSGDSRVIENGVQERPLVAVDAGTEKDGLQSPLVIRQGTGNTGET
jgi:hypothetical protein